MEYEKKISEELKGLRAKKGYSLEEIARNLNIHRETFRRYEKYPNQMDIGMFTRLLLIYEQTPSIFFDSIYGK